MSVERESELKESLKDKARIDADIDRVAETASEGKKKSSSRKRCRGCPDGARDWRAGGRSTCGRREDERQHDENIMRDSHIGKRGSETAQEQLDKLRNTLQSEQ